MKFSILWGWEINEKRGIAPDLPEFDDSERTWVGLGQVTSDVETAQTPRSDHDA